MKTDFRFRLKQVMEERDISASELSRLSGVGKSDISNYLNGKYMPKQDKVFLLANALGVNPGWLMTGVEQRTESEESEAPITDEARILAKGIDKLPPEQRAQALAVVRAMFAKYADYFDKENDDET